MSNSVFPRTNSEDTPTRASRATAPIPRWVIVFLVIILLLVLAFAILHFTGNGMGHMQMSLIQEGGHAR